MATETGMPAGAGVSKKQDTHNEKDASGYRAKQRKAMNKKKQGDAKAKTISEHLGIDKMVGKK